VHGWVEEEQRIFTLWHFYGGNCAMGWWLSFWRNFFDGGQKSLAGFCVFVLANARQMPWCKLLYAHCDTKQLLIYSGHYQQW